ncbi:MAG: MBL fold metallo-hydrolase [Sulfurovum sp.]|nr:MBL fold metallo-hydrolase [Sulfurovaceae bacterium]
MVAENIKLTEDKIKFLLEKEKLERAQAELIIGAKAIIAEKIKLKREKDAFSQLKREVIPVKIPVVVKAVQPVKIVNPVVNIVKVVKAIDPISPIKAINPIQEKEKEAIEPEIKITNIGEDKSIGEIIQASISLPTVTKKVESKVDVPFDYKLEAKKVAENVWCFFGVLDKPTKENAGFMVNSCYIKTNDGYLAMDTGPSYQFAKQSYEAMQKIEDLPVKFVVNSHEHDDHWLGNDFFKKKFGSILIGPESINTNYKDGDKTRMYNILPENAIKGTHIIKLDRVPTKTTLLTFGGEEFQIIPMDVKAHTGDDIFIYMPKRKILFAGDLVMNGRITSGRHGSVMGQLKALSIMQKLDWKVLVPGHGFITDARAMDEANLYFKLTKERVLKAIDEGVDATEINQVVKLIEFKDKAMYDILNAHNIGFAFEELEMLE